MGGTDKGLQDVCLVEKWERLVGWVLAPSTGRLSREGCSLEGAALSRGRLTKFYFFSSSVRDTFFETRYLSYSIFNILYIPIRL